MSNDKKNYENEFQSDCHCAHCGLGFKGKETRNICNMCKDAPGNTVALLHGHMQDQAPTDQQIKAELSRLTKSNFHPNVAWAASEYLKNRKALKT